LNEPPANPPGVSIGVFGQSTGPTGRGVVWFATSSTGETFGAIGRKGQDNTAGQNAGVMALTDSQNGRGLFAEAQANNGINFGVFDRS